METAGWQKETITVQGLVPFAVMGVETLTIKKSSKGIEINANHNSISFPAINRRVWPTGGNESRSVLQAHTLGFWENEI